MNFWILPVEVFGSGPNITVRGALEWARCFELIERVLGRDQGWLDYYQREVKLAELDEDQLARHKATEPFLVAAALSEAKYAAVEWRTGNRSPVAKEDCGHHRPARYARRMARGLAWRSIRS